MRSLEDVLDTIDSMVGTTFSTKDLEMVYVYRPEHKSGNALISISNVHEIENEKYDYSIVGYSGTARVVSNDMEEFDFSGNMWPHIEPAIGFLRGRIVLVVMSVHPSGWGSYKDLLTTPFAIRFQAQIVYL